MTQQLNELFRNHPIRFPLFLALCGFGAFGWIMFQADMTGLVWWYGAGFSSICGATGVLLLPVGIAVVVRRKRNPIALRCPHCSAASASCDTPFRVERLDHVPYAWIVCSRCGGDFTLDKHAVLRG